MTKTELIRRLSLKHQVSLDEATNWAESFISLIKGSLGEGEEVKLTGFGTFEVRTRAGGIRRNPRTGDKVEVGDRKTVGFRPSSQMKDFLTNPPS